MGPKKRPKTNKDSENVSDSEGEKEICQVCKEPFKSVLTHLARSKKTNCLELYNKEEYALLQDKKQVKRKLTQSKYDDEQKESKKLYQRQ